MTPNPLPLYKAVMPEHIEATKQLYCKFYDQCLATSAKLGCIQWTCRECPAFELMAKQQWKDDISRFVELAATVVDSNEFNVYSYEDIDSDEVELTKKTPRFVLAKKQKENQKVNFRSPREKRLAIAIDLVKQGWPTKQAAKHTNTASTTIRRACKKLGIQFSLGKPPGKERKLRTKTALAIELVERGYSAAAAAAETRTGKQTVINALEKYKSTLDVNLYGL